MNQLLTNNSANMKTIVETFIVEETVSLIYDNEQLDKWNEKVAELGLQGQTKIVQQDKSPVPFLWMNSALVNVFETLCPRKVAVEAYDKMPIPIEILELISLSKKEGYFNEIEIWFDDKTPDPVCVGYVYGDDEHSNYYRKWSANKYLIGKWSDVKASFSELIERAKNRFKNEKENELKLSIKNTQRELEDLDITVEQRFGNNVTSSNNLPF